MPTAKKQPSGMYRCRVYSHTDAQGKQHYRSFTAPTKTEAESLANKFSGKADRTARVDLTVNEVLNGYISAKNGVLSPSTVRGYRQMEKHFEKIGHKKIRRLTSSEVQAFISDLAKDHSPKTVMNIYGFLTASVALYDPDISWRVKLPPKQKKRTQAATDAQITKLFQEASPMLQKCIALAAFTSMRRGEICALKYKDIQGDCIHVHADMVHDEHGAWIYKDYPKTADSDRFAPVPADVIALLGTGDPDEYIIEWIPDTVTKRFIELRDKLGLGGIRFHDLRKYYASIAAALIPDIYAESFGGWRHGSRVMKEVYQQKIDPLEEQYANTMRDHFSKLIAKHDSKHDLKK